MSEVHRFNRIGDSTNPCGTPVLIAACFDFVLYSVYCLVPGYSLIGIL